MNHSLNRRQAAFALAAGAMAAGVLGGSQSVPTFAADETLTTAPSRPALCSIAAFTKSFNSVSFDELSDKTAELGFTGIEATVRGGGNVLPEEVESQLPKLVDALRRNGLSISVMTSDINDADDPLSLRVMQTASKLGIRHFRMAYVRYNTKSSVPVQIDRWRGQFGKLAAVCERLGMVGLYQNHAGDQYMGASLWDLDRILSDISPDQIGVAYDVRHAIVEGGMSWPTTWRMIQPRVRALFVKDFRWDENKVVDVPLGEGNVPQRFLRERGEEGFSGPLSLHVEYLPHNDPSLVPRHWESLGKDAATLRRWWTGS